MTTIFVAYQIKCLKDMHKTYRRVTFDLAIMYLVIFMVSVITLPFKLIVQMGAMLTHEFILIQQASLFLIKITESQILALICINMINKSISQSGSNDTRCNKA
jgi:hypothetical protein